MAYIISNSDIMKMFKSIDKIDASDKNYEEKARKIKKEIIESLSFLVYSYAKRYKNVANYEDLVQEGFVGLTKAVYMFDYHKFNHFFAYAQLWIKGYMRKAASRFDVVYDPEKKRVVYSMPDENEAIPEEDMPDTILEMKELSDIVCKELKKLDMRSKNIVQETYGINDDEHTLRDLGCKLNISHERVRQIKERAVGKLKKNKNIQNLV